MYLNDNYEGGYTRFQSGEYVVPQRGSALIFEHSLRHEGAPLHKGVKYVLRSDIMYKHNSKFAVGNFKNTQLIVRTMETYAIGDIHGGRAALVQLLKLLPLQPQDKLVFLGDYVDGWSESAQVVSFLLQLQQVRPCVFIKGNHDAWCLDWLRGERPTKMWRNNGGDGTLKSYETIGPAEKELHLAFFEKLAPYYNDDDNRLYIHAGYAHDPASQAYDSNAKWDRTLWEAAHELHDRVKDNPALYPEKLLLYHEIFIGHTPTLYYKTDQPMNGCNIWNIDTGAGFYGRLTAMNVRTKQHWQSDLLPKLYPDEIGRNR